MKVITEMDLRDMYRKDPFESFTLVAPERLTPAAQQFLSERRIRIIEQKEGISGGAAHSDNETPKINTSTMKEPEKGYLLMDSGEIVESKPEAYTHLRGRRLVLKNHKRIKFRGMLDLLEANYINAIIDIRSSGYNELSDDLTIIFEYTRKIMRAEVLEEPLEFIVFKDWTDEQIREYSHYPDKYFGVKHFTPDPKYGKLIAIINRIRAEVRQLETAAVDAFYDRNKKAVERQDIILALNRMSSLLYIIMCQYMGGFYKL